MTDCGAQRAESDQIVLHFLKRTPMCDYRLTNQRNKPPNHMSR